MGDRQRSMLAAPFAWLGLGVIVAGGVLAAAIAHRPSEPLVWLVAYLVLVVGVAQGVFGVGQAWLSEPPPGLRLVWLEWVLFNVGNAGVITGTLSGRFTLVAGGTALFAMALAMFVYGVRRGRGGVWLLAYRVLLGLLFASSLVGMALSIVRHSA